MNHELTVTNHAIQHSALDKHDEDSVKSGKSISLRTESQDMRVEDAVAGNVALLEANFMKRFVPLPQRHSGLNTQ